MKKLNYFQAHKNKKTRKKLPPRKPTQAQLDACIEYFDAELEKIRNRRIYNLEYVDPRNYRRRKERSDRTLYFK